MLAWNNLKTVDVDREGGSPASDQTGWKHQTLEPGPALPPTWVRSVKTHIQAG